MRLFSIQEVERFSHIKAGTLRIWEKRYNICQPTRTNGKNRRYNLLELELLLNIGLLNRNGFKISKLAGLNSESIRDKISSISYLKESQDQAINLLVIHKFSGDIDAFEKQLDHCFDVYGITATLKSVIIPFLHKVNLLSYTSLSNEVHLAVTSIRRKIFFCLESLNLVTKVNKSALLFLPKGEHYDLMLLFMSFVLQAAGVKVIYLGTNVPEENIIDMLQQKNPDYLFTYLPCGQNFKMFALSEYLLHALPNQKLNVVTATKSADSYPGQPHVNYIFYQEFQHLGTRLCTSMTR